MNTPERLAVTAPSTERTVEREKGAKNGKTSEYKKHARIYLQNAFPKVSVAAINYCLQSWDDDFTAAFRSLSEDDFDGAIPSKIKVFIKQPRKKKMIPCWNKKLSAEINALPELVGKENNPTSIVVASDHDTNNGDEKMTECLCCYGEYPLNQLRSCSNGTQHSVCSGCLKNFVTEQVDGNDSAVFKCIIALDCQNTYSTALLDQVLTPKLNKRVNERVFREQIKSAWGDSFWKCPKCAYFGFLDRRYPTVECPECEKFYCTKCNELSHPKKTCEDVKKEKELAKNPMHRAHEAMSKAIKRFCPRCGQEFTKGDGCNKIRCSSCKRLSCYLCGERIKDYSHFCQCQRQPDMPCPCGKKCELWTSTEKMAKIDAERRQKAGRKVLEEAGIMDEIEIKQILASPTKTQAAKRDTRVPAQPVPQVAPREALRLQPEQLPLRNDMLRNEGRQLGQQQVNVLPGGLVADGEIAAHVEPDPIEVQARRPQEVFLEQEEQLAMPQNQDRPLDQMQVPQQDELFLPKRMLLIVSIVAVVAHFVLVYIF